MIATSNEVKMQRTRNSKETDMRLVNVCMMCSPFVFGSDLVKMVNEGRKLKIDLSGEGEIKMRFLRGDKGLRARIDKKYGE